MDNQNQTPTTPTTGPGEPSPVPGSLPNSPLPGAAAASPPAASPAPAPRANPIGEPDEPNNAAEPNTRSTLSSIARGFSTIFSALFSWVIFPVAIVLLLHNFVFQAYHVVGTSMVPTLNDTDYLIISKLGYTQSLIERTFGQDKKYIPPRGQIVVFKFPKDTSRVFVKRVIGLPGDRVVIKNGTVTIYNKEHPKGFSPDADYESKNATTLIDTDEVIQEGNVFVMGDNRAPNGSYDSREWGELPSSYIIGNAVLRLLPLDQVKVL